MGDSTVRGLKFQLRKVDVWCLPGRTIREISASIQSTNLDDYDFLAVMAGTCDVETSSHRTMLRHYQELLDEVKVKAPHIIVVICAILPRSQDHDVYGQKVIIFNKGLKAKAIDQDLVYLTPYAPLQGRFMRPRSRLFRDNVHPGTEGVPKLVHFFRSNLNPRALRDKVQRLFRY